MKIAFVNQADVTATFYHSIAALSAFIKANSDHEVCLINFKGVINPYYFKHQIEKSHADVIAFSSMSVHWPKVKKLADLTKEVSSAITICGGYHPTFAPKETISHPTIDVICRGEGEHALLEFLDALENGQGYTAIQNLWVKKDGEIFKNEIRPLVENLDGLPFWDRDLFQYEKWWGVSNSTHYDLVEPERAITVSSGRGCYFDCHYCSNQALKEIYKQKGCFVRNRSVDNLIAEMKLLKERFNPEIFEVQEELFATKKNWLEEFAQKYPKEVGIPFRIWYRVDFASEQNIQLLAQAGCVSVSYGIECGNEEYRRKYLNRKMTNQQILDATERTKKAGIEILTFNMMGLPYETYDIVQETIELNRKIQPDFLQWFVYQPFFGTKLYEICRDNNLILDQQVGSFSNILNPLKLVNMTKEEFDKCAQDFLALQREVQGFDWTHLWGYKRYEPVTVRGYQPEDEYQMADLHNSEFGMNISPKAMMSFFQLNPNKNNVSVAVIPSGEIAGSTGYFSEDFIWNGKENKGAHMLGFVVEHGFRNAGKDVANKLLEHYTSLTHKHLFSYKLLRGNDNLYGFYDKRNEDEFILEGRKLVKTLSKPKLSIKNKIDKVKYVVRQITEKDDQVEQIWREYSPHCTFSKVKNLEYFKHRYLRKSSFKYLCLGLYQKKGGQLLGWAVLRLNWPTEDSATFMNYFMPNDDKPLKRMLLRIIENSAYLGGAKRLEAYFSPNSPTLNFFMKNGYEVAKEKIQIWIKVIDQSLKLDFIEKNWHFTFGDFYMY